MTPTNANQITPQPRLDQADKKASKTDGIKLACMMSANDMPIQTLINVFGHGSPPLLQRYYPPVGCCIVKPGSVHAIAVSSVMVALTMNSSLTALHAKPIADPVSMKNALSIIATMATVIMTIPML